MCSVPSRVTLSNGRLSMGHSRELFEEHDSGKEEYEYMNNQNLPQRHWSQNCYQLTNRNSNTHKPPAANHRLSIEGTESSGGLSQSSLDERSRSNADLPSSEGEYGETDLDQDLQYEYMDIRSGQGVTAPNTNPRMNLLRQGSHISSKNSLENNECEEEEYQYTNCQPRLRRSLMVHGLLEGEAEVYEYEEMDSKVAGGNSGAEYQNLQEKEEKEETLEQPCHEVRPFVKVHAGKRKSKEGTDRCFDNPDYWHSRLFSKSNAVRT